MANQFTENTFKKQYREKGFDYWTALKRRKAGMTEQEIFHKGSLKKQVKRNSINVYGKTYPNRNEAIKNNQIIWSTYYPIFNA